MEEFAVAKSHPARLQLLVPAVHKPPGKNPPGCSNSFSPALFLCFVVVIFSNNSQPQCWTLTELLSKSAIFVVKGFKRKKPRGFQVMKKQGGTVSHSCTNYLMNDIISKQTLTNSAINKKSQNWSAVYPSRQRINQLTRHYKIKLNLKFCCCGGWTNGLHWSLPTSTCSLILDKKHTQEEFQMRNSTH